MPVKTIYICSTCGERAENKVDTIFEMHRQGFNRITRTLKEMPTVELDITISGKNDDILVCDACLKKVFFLLEQNMLRVV